MANANNATGLTPVRHLSGAPWNGQTIKCWIPTTYGTSLYVGTPVILGGSANTDGTLPTIAIASAGAGNSIFGVITAFDELPTNLGKTYWAASDTPGRGCYVCCDPTVLYEVQGNSAGVIAATDVGALAALVVTSGGSTVTGLAGWELNYTGIATTNTLQVRIMGASSRTDNDITAIYAKWLVLINLNQLFTSASNASAGSTYLGAVGV